MEIFYPKTYQRIDGQSLTEPVTLDELKAQCWVTHDDEDAYLTMLITVAREAVEQATARSLIESEFVAIYDTNDEGFLWIPGGRIIEASKPFKQRAGGAITDMQSAGEYSITYTAGECPALAKMCILLWASNLYENRTPLSEVVNEVPFMLSDFIKRLRVWTV